MTFPQTLASSWIPPPRSIFSRRCLRRLPQLGNRGAYLVQKMQDKLVEHRQYIRDNGVDLPEIRNWKWDEGLNDTE